MRCTPSLLPLLFCAATAAGQARTSSVPATALGVYSEDGNREWLLLFRAPRDEQLWVLSKRSLFAVAEERSAGGWTLRTLGRSSSDEGSDEHPPPEIALSTLPGARWKLGEDRPFVHQADPYFARVLGHRSPQVLGRIDERAVRARADLRAYLGLLRDPDPAKRAAFSRNLDPGEIAAQGGLTSFLAREIRMSIDEASQALPAGERARAIRYLEALDALSAGKGELWPRSDDGPLADLLASRWPSKDVLTLEAGVFARLDLRDEGGRRGCTYGLAFPVAATTDARSTSPLRPPAPGKLAQMPAVFWALATGPSDSECALTLEPGRVYQPARGSFTFRVFADVDGAIVGAQLMSTQLFVAGGRSSADLATLVGENTREMLRQAE